MNADTLSGEVIDGNEHGRLTVLCRDRGSHIVATHLIDPFGNDGAVMRLRPPRCHASARRCQVMLPH
jgi:hypothetical protein